MERAAAEQVFRSLGARPDLETLAALTQGPGTRTSSLTRREEEVLALIAAGQSNRGIAGTLSISEKTVARHLSNIYGKLGISSRTEAARYAFENGLAGRSG